MTTFKNQRELAHAWAQIRTDNGKCNGGLFYEAKVLYSYGYHFPVAMHLDADTVLVNSDSYSVSTSKQQGYARNAITHKTRIYAPTPVIKAFCNRYHSHKETAKILFDATTVIVDKELKRAASRIKPEYRDSDIKTALSAIDNARQLCRYLDGVSFPARLQKIEASILADQDAFLTKHAADVEKERIKWEKKIAADRAKKRKEDAADFNLWRNGKSDYCPASHYVDENDGAYLRYCPLANGREIQTSRGASFPFDNDAKKAFALIRAAKEKGEKIEFAVVGKFPRLGNFHVDTIHKNGDVRAGCHFVRWDEIERVARQLQIYP